MKKQFVTYSIAKRLAGYSYSNPYEAWFVDTGGLGSDGTFNFGSTGTIPFFAAPLWFEAIDWFVQTTGTFCNIVPSGDGTWQYNMYNVYTYNQIQAKSGFPDRYSAFVTGVGDLLTALDNGVITIL